jgi:hypothetical protein
MGLYNLTQHQPKPKEVIGMPNDLTVKENVVALMKSSRSEAEWNANCDKVKATNNGYPSFWYKTIIASGLMSSIELDDTIKIAILSR